MDRWRARGWLTLNTTYRPCHKGFADVLSIYDVARRRWPRLPICAVGSSAGGHYAQLLATRRPSLDCVVSMAGLADFSHVVARYGHAEPPFPWTIPLAAFGYSRLRAMTPALHTSRVRARVLLGTARNDPVVSLHHDRHMQAALRTNKKAYVKRVVLEPGDHRRWIHVPVARTSAMRFYRAEKRLVAPLLR